MQYADDIYLKSYINAHVYSKNHLINSVIESASTIICQSFQRFWATHIKVAVTNILFKEQLLLAAKDRVSIPAN